MVETADFAGAKLALFLGSDLLVIRRDDRPDIPFPDHWDLPGGGREGDETPQACALRETHEEVGLIVDPSSLVWSRSYVRSQGIVWFFAAHLPAETTQKIVFGSEGQGWRLMTSTEFCENPMAVPHFVEQLQDYMRQGQFRDRNRRAEGKTPRC